MSDTKPHMQEAQRAPSKINAQGTYKAGMWYSDFRKSQLTEKSWNKSEGKTPYL